MNEYGERVGDPGRAVGPYGLGSFRTIDDDVSAALGIPLVADDPRPRKGGALAIQVVERSNTAREFEILLAQESSMAGAAAGAILVDRDGVIVASVLRSGRMSGKGSMNACAKEVAKKLAILRK